MPNNKNTRKKNSRICHHRNATITLLIGTSITSALMLQAVSVDTKNCIYTQGKTLGITTMEGRNMYPGMQRGLENGMTTVATSLAAWQPRWPSQTGSREDQHSHAHPPTLLEQGLELLKMLQSLNQTTNLFIFLGTSHMQPISWCFTQENKGTPKSAQHIRRFSSTQLSKTSHHIKEKTDSL